MYLTKMMAIGVLPRGVRTLSGDKRLFSKYICVCKVYHVDFSGENTSLNSYNKVCDKQTNVYLMLARTIV